MLYWSGQPSKEVLYEDSICREERFSIFLSVIVACGHETHFHGPLFSTLRSRAPQGKGARRWTLEYVLDVSLLMALEAGPTLQECFRQARQTVVEMFAGRKRPGRTYAGFVKARRRLPREHLRLIKRRLRRYHRAIAGPFWRREHWLAFAADGMRVRLPRTRPNEKAFGGAARDHSAPELSVTSLYHLGTGLPWAWRIGPGVESEQVQLGRMLGQLPRGALLIADAGFTSFALLRALRQRGVEVLVRMGSNCTLLTGLEDACVQVRGEWVWLWPKKKQTQDPPLKLRLVRFAQANHAPMCLATSVLDERVLTDQQIGQFYRWRWGQEVFHRAFKRTLAQHRMRSTSPGEARRELDWALLAYWLVGLWTVQAQIEARRDPLRWSVAAALRVVRVAVGPARGLHHRGGLVRQLRQAVKDGYVRKGSKAARYWPRPKNDHPPGLPKLRVATPQEKHRAIRIYETSHRA